MDACFHLCLLCWVTSLHTTNKYSLKLSFFVYWFSFYLTNTSLLSSFLLLPFGSSPSWLYVWSTYFFSNYSLTPCFLPLPCYTFVSLFIPIHDLTFVTLETGSHGSCNSSWDIIAWGRSTKSIERGMEKIQYGRVAVLTVP